MTFATYFPEQRHLLPMTLIRRERVLDDGIEGQVDVVLNQRVSVKDVIARGPGHASCTLLDGAGFFRLRTAGKLANFLKVDPGSPISAGDVLAQRGRRKLLSPVTGRVIDIQSGHILLQAAADSIDLEAGLNGTVVEIRPRRGAVIETIGAVLQGVWGNGRRAISTLRMEPSAGIELLAGDALQMQYRGGIIVTRKPLRALVLDVIEEQSITGVIAPSMEPSLLERVQHMNTAVLLTEGFGTQRMSTTVFQFLNEMDTRPALLDARPLSALAARRPEIVITVPLTAGRPAAPLVNLSLQLGADVRLASGTQAGSVGRVVSLPEMPILMDNGLRVRCAEVELISREKLMIPLVNLESSGRSG